jgi:NADH-quinone oxidoreductase subunit E
MDNQTPESATALVDDLREGREVRSTRGPRICTWREAERVLAGFPDDLADEGPAGGPATLVGLELARKNDWRAPGTDRKEVAGRSDGDATTGRAKDELLDTSPEKASEHADTSRAEAETKAEEGDK